MASRSGGHVKTAAFITPLYFSEQSCLGGGERYPLNLARGVVRASKGTWAVKIISFGKKTRCEQLSPGIELWVLGSACQSSDPFDQFSWELPRAIAAADLVHVHQVFTRTGDLGILAAKLSRKPVCASDLGATNSRLGEQAGILEIVDCVVCYSDFGASLLCSNRPAVIIKGGVDAEYFAPPSGARRRDRVLYVGRLLPHKGIDRLLAAVPPDLPLTVCGRPYHKAYHQLLRKLARGKQVEFVTDADDRTIRELYTRSWANVLPSVYVDCYGHSYAAPELMGLTLLEAMACGTPAICARVAAMPEFVRHDETGYVFDEVDQLRQQLTHLANQPDEVERLGRNARAAAIGEYDLGVVGAKLIQIYDDLIHAHRVPSGEQKAA